MKVTVKLKFSAEERTLIAAAVKLETLPGRDSLESWCQGVIDGTLMKLRFEAACQRVTSARIH